MQRSPLFLPLALALAPCAAAQGVHWSVAGDAPFDELGASLAAAGDLDGDGVTEWIATTLLATTDSVRVGSGATGATLFQWDEPPAAAYYGRIAAGAGDVNADGVPDIVIGGSRNAGATGFVELRSGVDGSLLATWLAPTGSAHFGTFVGAAGDLNQDGRADVLVGDPYRQPNGRLEVRSGSTGNLLRAWSGAGARRIGWRAVELGDVDGDGFPDYAASVLPDEEGDGPGLVRVLSGGSGAVLHERSSGSEGYGWIVGLGDLDGDGVGDLAVTEWEEFGPERLELVSGASATLLLELADFTTSRVVNATGVLAGVPGPVVAIAGLSDGVPASGSGSVSFLQVPSGAVLRELDGVRPYEGHGGTLLTIDDVDGDGLRELLARRPSLEQHDRRGFLRLLDLDCGGVSRTCVAAPNSVSPGGARLFAGPLTSVGENELYLSSAFVPSGPHLYIASQTPAQAPFGDGWRCVGGQVVRLGTADGPGSPDGAPFRLDLSASGPIGAQPGATWYAQLWFRDPQGGPAGFNLSDALALTLCP